MITAEIEFAARVECARQHVGEDRVDMLLEGYTLAWGRSQIRELPAVEDALELAGVLEPSSGGVFRRVPVVFDEGGSGAAPAVVMPATGRIFELLDRQTDPDEFTRAFLSVHPFTDGNGRVAWVLRTWLKSAWEAPEPLPDYHW